MKTGVIFPQDNKWYLVTKVYKKKVRLRELLNYKIGDTKLIFGQSYMADLKQDK